ncbi:hypothetical protein MATL_G00065280 [Megalops atlanticus]|uniref:Uncharacterized protein n=1 Tax=Megalops atlanticus TaxID=7932 RepID=A0A9D3QA25_MEGAT|nr:hypothetical protein MATL_G00065280 [Megalops atlanticus]
MGQEGQLGHGEKMTFLPAPSPLQSDLLSAGVVQIDTGDSYSAALSADGTLSMWGRNCHVMDAGRPDSQRAWSPQKVELGDREARVLSCGTWHVAAVAVAKAAAERSRGNRESDFRETGARFKEDSNYPQLMELEPRENSNQTQVPPAVGEGEPVNRAEVPLRSRSPPGPGRPGNAPFGDMDKTDLLGERRSDGTPGAGNGRSSITRRGDGGSAAAVPGEGRPLGRLRRPPIPDGPPSPRGPRAGCPSALPELQRRGPSRCRSHGADGGQLPSSEPWGCGGSSSVAPSSRSLQQRSVPGTLPVRLLRPGPSHRGQQSVPQRQGRASGTRHLSPLTPRPRPSSSSSPSLSSLGARHSSPAGPAQRSVYKQAIYSSGTAWKDVSMSADPVLSHKRPSSAGQQLSQKQ